MSDDEAMREPRMRDLPMLDEDRERMRAEFEGFDDMTMGEFKAIIEDWTDDALDLMTALRNQDPGRGH